ncbi:MAG: FAD-dependent oxidoreductase [Solirubrobacteraceae bacterium]
MADVPGIGLPETGDNHGAFPRLTDEQLDVLRGIGTRRTVQPGEVLFREGDDSYDFFAIEEGSIAIVQGYGGENRVIAVHGAHRFTGELNLLTGTGVYLTAVVREPGTLIEIAADDLRELVAENEELSNLIMRAYLQRREILIGMGTGLKIIGSRFSPDTRRLREFLTRNRLPYRWRDLEDDTEAEEFLRGLGVTPAETPVVIWTGGDLSRNPSNAEVAARIGLSSVGPPPPLCDLVVIGAGPAGLSAALYGASEGLDTQAVDEVALGGQASTSSRIENYLGFPAGISGSELAERAAVQARKFGARLVVPGVAVGLEQEDGHYAVALAGGEVVRGRTLIVATGAQYNKLDVPDLERFEGVGVYYAATPAEARMCEDDPVLIVGGGNSAGQAAIFLSGTTGTCHLMIRGGDLGKSMSRYLVDQIERDERLGVMHHTEVRELRGEDGLEAVVVGDTRTGERRELGAKALFVFIGASPHTDWLRGQVALDDKCFVLAGRELPEDALDAYDGDRPLFLETSRPGIFAVGDVHAGSIKRVASAVGEGSMAVRLVHQRLAR